jgi:hypothetical protein
MKLQDVILVLIGCALLVKRDARVCFMAGLACILISIPFFASWVFFTGQRLLWYAAVYFMSGIIFSLRDMKLDQTKRINTKRI